MIHLIWSVIVGFFVGLIAHWFVPGVTHGFWVTAIVGIVGSLIGGFIGALIKKPVDGAMFHPAGFFMSIIGAIILLAVLHYSGIQL
ncbi:MAG: GlsB/YeaQ/YmgE family stress response membrane protein [Rudaea sp.]|nr:GlsB/YeaQ/YmgE family stress response membrane protein [Rudaea sp.]